MKHVGLSVYTVLLTLAALRPLEAAQVCGTPGKDGPFTGGGIVNTYLPPSGNIALQPGATSFDVGTSAGANVAVTNGDLLLIMQMQDGRFNASNTDSYGSGLAGPGSGFTDVANAGLYEYVVVTDVTGSTLTITGAGPGGGLINKYVHEDFQNAAHTFDENNDGDVLDPEDDHTVAHGRRRFQIIRVPQYSSLTINAQMTCLPWNPATAVGGVLAVDVQGALTFSGAIDHVDVTRRGFRGAAATRARGNLSGFAGLYSNTDFRQRSDQPSPEDGAHGNKGEGISGTPRFVFDPFEPDTALAIQDLATEGYPNGIRARGAPGTAGGGGNAGNVSNGTQESGGGGGGNGGPGGAGGNSNGTNLAIGGRGGAAFPWAINRLAMGGGGGGGQRNDASDDNSHAASGGGIVLIRANTVSVTGAANGIILADGGDAPPITANDGGGGAGAGGSVLLFARTAGQLGNVLVFARGGAGGDAGSGNAVIGPGGGGGGGVILASDVLGGADTGPGPNGFTGLNRDQVYGSGSGTGDLDVPGDPGNPFVTEDDIPGAGGGAGCSINDAPDAVDDAASTSTDTLVNILVLANDTDPDGDALMITDVSDPPNGTASINGNTIDYTPDPAFTGVDTFTYTIDDNNGNTDTATVTVTVGNFPPVNTVPGAQITSEDTALVFTGGNAISVDDPDDSNASIQVTLTVTSGTLTLSGTTGLGFSAGDGTADATMTFSGAETDVNAALNGLSFQPAPGSLAPVTLTVATNDLAAGNPLTDTDNVGITVTPVNDPPVAVADAYGATTGVARIVGAAQGVLANDTDVEGDTLTAVLDTDVANGVLTLNADGSFTYTSNGGFTGNDSFTYHANDGTDDSNIVTVTITVSNNPPVANDDAYDAVNGVVVVAAPGVLLNDVDADPLTAVLDVGPANGSLTLNSDGSFNYTADPGFAGDDTFTYHANDGSGDSNIATVTITVEAVALPRPRLRAGYCGLIGFEALLLLGLLRLRRRAAGK